MEKNHLTAVFVEAEEGGYVAYIDEMRGVITQGESLEEAEENLFDAFKMFIEVENNPYSWQIRTISKPFISFEKSQWKERILKSI